MRNPMAPKPLIPRKRALGGGMKADDGVTDVSRNNLALDPIAEAIFLKVGNGNKSLGAREAVMSLCTADGFIIGSPRETKVSVSRMHKHGTGWGLVQSVQ